MKLIEQAPKKEAEDLRNKIEMVFKRNLRCPWKGGTFTYIDLSIPAHWRISAATIGYYRDLCHLELSVDPAYQLLERWQTQWMLGADIPGKDRLLENLGAGMRSDWKKYTLGTIKEIEDNPETDEEMDAGRKRIVLDYAKKLLDFTIEI